MPGGRPTDYDPSFVQKADEYLTSGWKKDVVPSRQGFAQFLGFTKPTILEWAKKYEEFSYALEKIDDEQYRILQNQGLAGTFSSTITKLMLSGNHGIREKTDVTSDDKAIGVADAVIEAIKSSK